MAETVHEISVQISIPAQSPPDDVEASGTAEKTNKIHTAGDACIATALCKLHLLL